MQMGYGRLCEVMVVVDNTTREHTARDQAQKIFHVREPVTRQAQPLREC